MSRQFLPGDLIEFPNVMHTVMAGHILRKKNKNVIGIVLSSRTLGQDFPLINLKVMLAGGVITEVCDSFTKLIQEAL
jgi:hypothetical protein